MKKTKQFLLFLTLLVCLGNLSCYSQSVSSKKKLPNIEIKSLNGAKININDLLNNDGPTVISFWATWCKPCLNELAAVNDVYEDWVKETNVKLIAISVDDARFYSKVKGFVSSKDWDFEAFSDGNQDLKRALNVNTIPHVILLDKNNKVVWEHTSYVPGAEFELYEQIKKVSDEK